MGGKNHQPCSAYLKNSTKLSRSMSLAFISMELANVALEDLILLELEEKVGSVESILSHLDESLNQLQCMEQDIENLHFQMDDLGYSDLPTLKTTNLESLGKSFQNSGVFSDFKTWNKVSDIMLSLGFYGMFPEFESQTQKLINLTNNLRGAVALSARKAGVGKLHFMLEENQKGNFKAEFAMLYNSWTQFQQLFLASSLISTELWYNFNVFGSLSNTSEHVLKTA